MIAHRVPALLVLALMVVPGLAQGYHYSDEPLPPEPSTEGGRIVLPGGPTLPLPFDPDSTLGVDPSRPPPVDLPDVNRTGRGASTFPTLDAARDALLDTQAGAVQRAEAIMASRNLSADVLVPRVPSNVMSDDLDGARVGGIGEWKVVENASIRRGRDEAWATRDPAGHDNTTGWTTGNATRNTYRAMDAWLVTPAIDLSPYVLPTGTVPHLGGRSDETSVAREPFYDACISGAGLAMGQVGKALPGFLPLDLFQPCREAAGVPETRVLQDQILLTFSHRYNFPEGLDGGQVVVLTSDPRDRNATSTLLRPMPLYGSYEPRVTSLKGPGFSGHQDWEVAAFDLTPWAGKTVWVAFRAATSPSADAGDVAPDADAPETIPLGWSIDDVQVRAPAVPKNLKVYSLATPDAVPAAGERTLRLAPNSTATTRAVAFNAGSLPVLARLTLRATPLPDGAAVHAVERTLQPGEVLAAEMAWPTPPGGEVRTVAAIEAVEGENGTTLREAHVADNRLERAYTVAVVKDFAVEVEPSAIIVDYNAEVKARGKVTNVGNVPIEVDVELIENHTWVPNVTSTAKTGVLAPGASRSFEWGVTTALRGEHLLVLNGSVAHLGNRSAQASYHVHASPPPVFEAVPGEEVEWEFSHPNVAILDAQDGQGVMWATTTGGTLAALPVPEARDGSTKVDRLRLTARIAGPAQASVRIVYSSPVSLSPVAATILWEGPISARPALASLASELASGWRVVEMDVVPREASGYLDGWSTGLLALEINSGAFFYVDSLVLSGVPVGYDDSERRDIVRVTGDEPEDQVRPAQPSDCGAAATNCWRKVRQGETPAATHAWKTTDLAPLPDGSGATARYVEPKTQTADRILTPVLRLHDATDPVLTLDHAYTFLAFPNDMNGVANYDLSQIGFVALQYRRDDGLWSPFVWLEPEGGYPHVLEKNSLNMARTGTSGKYVGGDGFYYPTKCVYLSTAGCSQGGFTRNFGPHDRRVWIDYGPSPHLDRSTFRLSVPGVDLSDREIRLAFQAATRVSSIAGNVQAGEWALGHVRLRPLSVAAIDAAVHNVTLDVPYDWENLGAPSGIDLPVRFEVRNEGLFAEAFNASLTLTLAGGETVEEKEVSLGFVAPGETRLVELTVSLPAAEGLRYYDVRARVSPTDEAIEDENPFNDHAPLVQGAGLPVLARADVSLEGAVFPPSGRPGVPRYVPLTLHNDGNLAVPGLAVERTIERVTPMGTALLTEDRWTLGEPLEADPTPVPLDALAPTPEVPPDGLFFTPTQAGTYILTARLVLPPGVEDADADDNVVRQFFVAETGIAEEDFEEGVAWTPSVPNVWQVGEGFQSARSVAAAGDAQGLLPASSDLWLLSPSIPLATANAARVNLFVKHELEEGYDGARVEVSKDNRTWIPLRPDDVSGATTPYAGTVSNANPLTGPDRVPTDALTGSSRESPVNLDGWTPLSFDLTRVPELTRPVVLASLAAPPEGVGRELEWTAGVGTAPWLAADATGESQWAVRNETGVGPAPKSDAPTPDTFWWSGFITNGNARTLGRTFPAPSAVSPGIDFGDDVTLRLDWWERRSGSTHDEWEGVGSNFSLRVRLGPGGVDVASEPRLLESRDGWHHLYVEIDASNVDEHAELHVIFEIKRLSATAANLGWAIEEIRLEASRVVEGRREVLHAYTAGDEPDVDAWVGQFVRVSAIPERPAAWEVVEEEGDDGETAAMWRLALRAGNAGTAGTNLNVDTRLTSPTLDLSSAGGARPTLKLVHKYRLLDNVNPRLTENTDWREGKAYQAATVEVQRFDRQTSTWGPWEQLYATPQGPSREPADLSLDGAAPYPRAILDQGASFERYPRTFVQEFTASGQANFTRLVDASVSYAFTGNSTGDGFIESTFDLTRFAGETIRVAFHAWSGPTDPEKIDRYWTIARAELTASTLDVDQAWVRLRVGTDGSTQQGSFAVDRFEIAGTRTRQSLALTVDAPESAAPGSVAVVRGTIENKGETPRSLVAVGIAGAGVGTDETPRVLVTGSRVDARDGPFLAIAGPFDLAPAGSPGSRAEFEFLVTVDDGRFRLRAQTLEGVVSPAGIAYRVPHDDLPGRARAAWEMAVVDKSHATTLDVEWLPPYLDAPGSVFGRALVRNDGTRPLDGPVRATWSNVDDPGAPVVVESAPLILAPGEEAWVDVPAARLPAFGNHSVDVRLAAAGADATPLVEAYRVGRGEVLLAESFERSPAGWTMAGDLLPVRDSFDAKDGGSSVRFGLTGAEYADGQRLEQGSARSGELRLPTLDLRAAGPDAELRFWHKPAFGAAGAVRVQAMIADSGDAASCDDWTNLTVLQGRSTAWIEERLSLGQATCRKGDALVPLEGRVVDVRFLVENADDQGWRVDAVSVTSTRARLSPDLEPITLADGTTKEFLIVVHNPGRSPRELTLGIDPSTVTAAQRAWMELSPTSMLLAPGEEQVATLRVTSPPARIAVPQVALPGLTLTGPQEPFAGVASTLELRLRPLPRADLVAALTIDGKTPLAGRTPVEEGVPHEMTVVVTNEGAIASRPVDVEFSVRDDATGLVLWRERQRIAVLEPSRVAEASHLVTAAWRPELGKRGNHTLRVVVDPLGVEVDADRRNDDVAAPLDVVRLLRPDLAIDDAGIHVRRSDGRILHEAVPGQIVRIEAEVRNAGPAPARDVTVRILADGAVLKEESLGILAPGATRVVSASQFAPAQTTRYGFLALTPDLELRPDNNAGTIQLEVFPPDVAFDVPDVPALALGEVRVVPVTVRNDGAGPSIVDLSAAWGGHDVGLSAERLALAPGEEATVDVTLTPSRRQAAGVAPLVLKGLTDSGSAARSTLDVAVRPSMDVDVVPLVTRGPPGAVRVQFEAVNVGNVPVTPLVVVRDAAGEEVARAAVETIAVGGSRLHDVLVRLPGDSAPGERAAALALEVEGAVVGRASLSLDVLAWGRATLDVPLQAVGARADVPIRVTYEGNVPAVLRPVLLGLPPEVVARPDRATLDLQPGEQANVTFRVEATDDAPTGLFAARAALLDAAGATGEPLTGLAPVSVDLRRAKVEIASHRILTSVPRAGEPLAIEVALRNAGERPLEPIQVLLYADGRLVATARSDAIEPGASDRVALRWDATAGEHSLVVSIDPASPHARDAPAIGETVVVQESLLSGASRLRGVPGPEAWGLVAMVVAAAWLARGERRRPGR